MTSAEFAAAYRVLRRLTSESVPSYTAQHVATQRPVMVHVLDRAVGVDAETILRDLDRLGPADRGRIHDRLDVDGTPVVVTQVLAEFESFPRWLESHVAGHMPPRVSEPASGRGASATRPETSHPLQAIADADTAILPRPVERAPTLSEVPAAPVQSPKQPGEFTRMFGQASAGDSPTFVDRAHRADERSAARASFPEEQRTALPAPSAPPAPSVQSSPPSPPAAPSLPPGEFTRLFGQSEAPRRTEMPQLRAPAPPPPPTFASPSLPSTPPAPPPVAARPLPPAAPIVQPAMVPPPPPPIASVPPASPVPGAALPPLPPPMLGISAQGGGATFPSSVPAPHPAAPSLPHGPSAFTRIIGGASAAPPRPVVHAPPPANVPQPGGAPAADGGARARSHLPVLIVLNVVVVIAVALVLYFALSR